MTNDSDSRDLAGPLVPLLGSVQSIGDPFRPFRLVDAGGSVIGSAESFFAELAACGRPAATQRSYAMDLLRWFRFMSAVGMGWAEATRVEARDFCRWLMVADKPVRPHWRDSGGMERPGAERAQPLLLAGTPNAVTGERSPGAGYEAATVAHCESVLRGFYDFHLEAGEYRTPSDEEWTEFLGHFERRKVAVGDCGRSYATPCIHEHSCLRCPLLRPDPAERGRLTQIRDNLLDRITEAETNRWFGEAEGLRVSLAGARDKLAQMGQITSRRETAINLGIPTFTEAAGRVTGTPRPGQTS